MKLTVGKIIEVEIMDLDYRGYGVAKYNDNIIFMPNALVGEKVEIKINKVKKNICEATVLKRIETSLFRTKEQSHLGSLDLEHLTFLQQLQWQKELTKKTLEKVLKKEINVLDTVTDYNEYHYRNKVVFHVLEQSTLTLGLYQNEPIKLIKVNDFSLATPFVNEMIKKINDAQIEIDEKKFKHIVFKNNQNNEYMVTLVSYEKYFKGLENLIDLLKQQPEIIGITLNIKPNDYVILGSKSYALYQENMLKEKQFYLTDQTFFQVNYPVMEKTYELIKENVKSTHIIDAYSGIGSIGFSLINDQTKEIIMIESHDENIKIAEKIKEENDYQQVTIYQGKAEDILKKFSAQTLIVDPPRQGLMKQMVEKMLKYQYEQVIYLSCSLQTLTRDLKLLDEIYDIEKVYPIKMFPQTTSIETLVIIKRR